MQLTILESLLIGWGISPAIWFFIAVAVTRRRYRNS
jgi:hypothetical protein